MSAVLLPESSAKTRGDHVLFLGGNRRSVKGGESLDLETGATRGKKRQRKIRLRQSGTKKTGRSGSLVRVRPELRRREKKRSGLQTSCSYGGEIGKK